MSDHSVADSPTRKPFAAFLVGAIVLVKLALHLVALAVTQFGVHRDEFLYLAMGQHLRFWRMDFPPLIGILGNASVGLFGHTLAAVRVFPAIEGCLLVIVAALIARELGGARVSQALTALCMLGNVLFFRSSTLFQPVVLDQLWWTLSLYALVRLAREERPKWWVVFGVTMGFGLLTKFSILFFGFSALVAIAATPTRTWLKTRWPWIAAAIALLIGSPSIAGQLALDFPVIAQMKDLQGDQLTHVTWSAFLTAQPLMVGPVPFILALIGAISLVAWKPMRRFAVVGWTCINAFILLFLLHGKPYYIGPIYPTLIAAGCVMLERFHTSPGLARVIRFTTIPGIVAFGLLTLPLGIPVLSPEATAAYATRIGATSALRTNQGAMDRLPQDYADMLGWENQSRTLAAVVSTLPPAERDSVVIVAGNYGEAGAAEFYSSKYRLPPVISPVGSYWFFGPGDRSGAVVVTIGVDSVDLAKSYQEVHTASTIRSEWSVQEERVVPVLVGRKPKLTLQQIWPSLAGMN
jgi:hypothetical protein